MTPLRLLHVFSTFVPAGPQVRTVTIMNALGRECDHTVLAMDGRTGAADLVDPPVPLRLVPPPPDRSSPLTPLRLHRVLRELQPDAVITYNWGAIDAVIAAVAGRSCPVVHTEDGFGPDEAVQLKPRRVWTRRLVLRGAALTVVPSRNLLRIAREQYRLPEHLVRFIPNGIDLNRFTAGRNEPLRQAWQVRPDEVLFGFVGHLRAEKNPWLLLRALAECGAERARLVFLGDGPLRAALEAEVRERGWQGRVLFAGAVTDPAPAYQACDVFALSSDTEQMPLSLLEAMGSGLPALVTDVGDCGALVGTAGGAVIPRGDLAAYAAAIREWAAHAERRTAAGQRNRRFAEKHHSLPHMVAEYRRVYEHAAGRAAVPAVAPRAV